MDNYDPNLPVSEDNKKLVVALLLATAIIAGLMIALTVLIILILVGVL